MNPAATLPVADMTARTASGPPDTGTLPPTPGVYLFRDAAGQLLYVGKAKNLRRRVASYFRPGAQHGPRIESLVARTASVEHQVLVSEDAALLREAELIKAHAPPYNIRLRDGKRYPLLRVKVGRDAEVALVRVAAADRAFYFGPCPRSGELREAIKAVRRLYTRDLEVIGRSEGRPLLRRRRARMARDIAACLLGTDDRLERRLEREIRRAARSQHFERAASLHAAMAVLASLAAPHHPHEPQA